MPEKENEKTLTQKVESLGALIVERMDKGDKGLETLHAEMAGVKIELKKHEEWSAEIEKKYEKARRGQFGEDAQKAVIPARYLKSIETAARSGYKDPVKVAAMAAWLKDIARISVPQRFGIREIGPILNDLEKLEQSFGMEPAAKAALTEGTGSEGGFTVPTPLEAEVLRVIEDSAVLRPLARKMSMTAFKHNIPDLTTGISVDIIDEEGSITEVEPVFGQKVLTAKKFAARGVLSMELQQDSSIGIVDFWLTLAEEQLGLKEDEQALEGDGAGANFTGVVAASGVNEVQSLTAGVPTNGGVAKYDELVKTKWKAAKRSTRRGAAWIAPPELARNVEALVDSQLRPIWSNPTAGNITALGAPANGGPDGVLLGYPVWSTDVIRVDRTVGTLTTAGNVYFGPWGHGMIYGDLIGIMFGVSEHVLWNTAQLVARLIKRTGILVGVPADFTKYTGVNAA